MWRTDWWFCVFVAFVDGICCGTANELVFLDEFTLEWVPMVMVMDWHRLKVAEHGVVTHNGLKMKI